MRLRLNFLEIGELVHVGARASSAGRQQVERDRRYTYGPRPMIVDFASQVEMRYKVVGVLFRKEVRQN